MLLPIYYHCIMAKLKDFTNLDFPSTKLPFAGYQSKPPAGCALHSVTSKRLGVVKKYTP